MKNLVIFAMAAVVVGCASEPPAAEKSEILAAAKSEAPPAKRADFSRYLTTKICYKKPKHCIGPTAKALEESNVFLTWEPYTKGGAKGLTARDVLKIEDQGVPFTFEYRITKPDGATKYNVYLMLRSGPGTKRKGTVRSLEVADLKELDKLEFTDTPYPIEGGSIQVGAVLGQELTITR